MKMKSAIAGLVLAAVCASGAWARVGTFQKSADIGGPKHPGSARYVDGHYVLTAGGANMFRAHDEFHFVWRKLKGDFVLTAQIAFTGPGKEAHRKAGLMVRADLGDNATYVDGTIHGQGPTAVQLRRASGGDTEMQVFAPPAGAAETVRLERHGRTITVSAAPPGQPLVRHEVTDVDLGETVYVGLFLCAHDPDQVETAQFDQVTLGR